MDNEKNKSVSREGAEQTRSNGSYRRKWDSRSQGPRLGNLIFMKLIAWGGLTPAYGLLRAVALWYAVKNRKTVRAIRLFLERVGLPVQFTYVYRHMYSFGQSLIDGYAFLYKRTSPFTFTCDGEDHIAEALQKGKGLILVTAHIGNWEIAGNLLFDRFRTRVNFIMMDEEREEIRDVFRAATDRRRVNIIPVSADRVEMMVRVRAALGANEILCIVGDRVSGAEECRLLPFLGKNARFPTGPFVFGAITGAPVIAVFSLKEHSRHYLLKVYGSMNFDGVSRAQRNDAVDAAMRRYVGMLEEIVRKYPHQWFNLYDYWE